MRILCLSTTAWKIPNSGSKRTNCRQHCDFDKESIYREKTTDPTALFCCVLMYFASNALIPI